nr:hypothetical protein [Nocardia wallacei]
MDAELIKSVFAATGSVNRAAKTAGVAFSVARRILVADGVVGAARRRRGKPEARRRYRADQAAAAARARTKRSKLVDNQPLRDTVAEGLSRRLSPEQISHRLRKDFPDDESMRVSHETIWFRGRFISRLTDRGRGRG